MTQRTMLAPLVVTLMLLAGSPLRADGLLDGRVFSGMIGPVENPDLPDRLFFDNGHFWSGICTECGFVPGRYDATRTAAGIAFSGTLHSDTRGQFDYDGLVRPDGSIQVDIQWQRPRWYWTSRREIAFVGAPADPQRPVSLSILRKRLGTINPDANPQCARF